MNRINPARLGLSLAITVGLLYLLCALMVVIALATTHPPAY